MAVSSKGVHSLSSGLKSPNENYESVIEFDSNSLESDKDSIVEDEISSILNHTQSKHSFVIVLDKELDAETNLINSFCIERSLCPAPFLNKADIAKPLPRIIYN